MNRDDGVGRIVLAAEHLPGFDGVDLGLERVERLRQIGGDVLATPRPFEQHADIVDFLGEAVALLEIFSETALPLEGLLRFGLVVPESGGGDAAFELR
jgi:hypothetical protein